jgi:phosphatidylglycerol:prolipoprotein diacylglycerol transferase
MAQQSAIRNRPGIITGAFLAGYAIARSVCELFREPDSYLGFIVGGISMGQILSFPMLLAGIGISAYALGHPRRTLAAP